MGRDLFLPSAEPYDQQTLFWHQEYFWGAEDPVLSSSIGLNILGTEDQPILCTQNVGGRGSILATTI